MPFTDADLAGRSIDTIFTSSAVPMTNQKLFTCNQSPEIASSGKTGILFVSCTLSAGAANGSSTMAFGSSAAAVDWTGALSNVGAFSDVPIMFYPYYFGSLRPGVYANGTGFYLTIGGAFNAGATGIFTIYGFTY